MGKRILAARLEQVVPVAVFAALTHRGPCVVALLAEVAYDLLRGPCGVGVRLCFAAAKQLARRAYACMSRRRDARSLSSACGAVSDRPPCDRQHLVPA